MNVRDRNALFAKGDIDRDDLWTKIREYESKAFQFRFWFGLSELPKEPGLIFVRGPRQFGKSTWLELELLGTLEEYGAGSAFYLNGDEIEDYRELVQRLEEVDGYFPSRKSRQSGVKRLFIDEVTAVSEWERAFKIVLDRGLLRDVLIVTTGSRAADIRRGAERLPGRKGKLGRTDYVFLPIPFKNFIASIGRSAVSEVGMERLVVAYLLSGGSPVALNDLIQFEVLPEYFVTLTRDWILGEFAASGRHRASLLAVLSAVFRFGGTPVGFAKLARETGMANNTVAAGYIDLLSDLFTVLPSWQWDQGRDIFLFRKPCKFHFVNLAAAIAFFPSTFRHIEDFLKLDSREKAKFLEWLVAAELFRRNCLRSPFRSEELGFIATDHHEIDFVDSSRSFYEVKSGSTSPIEFSWFNKSFPGKTLHVVSESEFSAGKVKSTTFAKWLYDCELDPWPYAGMEEWDPFRPDENGA